MWDKYCTRKLRSYQKGETREVWWLLAVTVVEPVETPAFA